MNIACQKNALMINTLILKKINAKIVINYSVKHAILLKHVCLAIMRKILNLLVEINANVN